MLIKLTPDVGKDIFDHIFHFSFSDLESGCLLDPPVEAMSSLGRGQEVVPLRYDPPLQQQQRKQENSSSGKFD